MASNHFFSRFGTFVLSVAMLLCCGSMAVAQSFKVGTFTKSTTTASGCSSGCPTNVVTHNLGDTPKALIVWSAGKTGSSFAGSYVWTFGITDGTTSRSASAASTNNSGNSRANRRNSSKFAGFVSGGGSGTVVAEADFTSWNSTNFTITWTTNDNQPYIMHYLLIGGDSVSAKVVVWQSSSTSTVKSVTGIGFQPTVVLNVNHGHNMAYSALGGVPSANIVGTHAGFGLGVMNNEGTQWSNGFYAIDSAGTMDTQRGQKTNATWFTVSNNLTTTKTGTCVSPCMTADGFDVTFTIAGSDLGGVAFSLALAGVNSWSGTFNKNTTSATSCSSGCPQDSVTGLGFQPGAVLLTSVQDITRTGGVAHGRLGLGASDGASHASTALTDTDATASSTVWAIDKATKAFIKVNNAGTTAVAPVIDAEADLTIDADGFTTSWTTNDTVATEMLYLAFGPLQNTAVELTSLNATRYDSRVLVDWRTGYETDNLGFNVYREVNGQRVRVNQSLVGGSGLMAGQGTATRGEQRYAVWDQQAFDRSAVYWLEDLDFNGTRTTHGPITPVDGRLQAAPEVASSSALRDLAKQLKRRGKLFVTAGAKHPGQVKAAEKSSVAVSAEMQAQRSLAAKAAIKIGVTHAGWYRVTQPELVAAGLDPNADPQALRLFADGIEHAVTVTGAADGRFDSADAIEFYGSGLDTAYADTRTYWLTLGGRGGRRVTAHGAPGSPNRTSVARSFRFTLQQKERSIYFAALRNGDKENWFGAFVSEEPTDLTLNVSNILPGSAAEIEVTMQGVTSTIETDPDHRVGVLVNGTEVGVISFDGQSNHIETFVVPAGVLAEGANTVTVVARGGEADYSLVDVIRLHYSHVYRADADLLRFTADGPGDVTITGFAGSAIRVVDITDPLAVEELRGAVRSEGGFSSVTIRIPAQGARTLLAFSDASVARPVFVRANTTSQWHAATNAAEYVAVTHAQFAGNVAPLLERRALNGLSVARVDIEDVYDEFSFGEKSPQALKDFVTHARTTWKTAPRFLVLVGDATLDPRDYAAFGDADFVPSKQIPMVQVALETVSDEWFADADDDGLPEIAVGRLSVRTPEQAHAMVAKILAYEDGDSTGWDRNVLLVTGEKDEAADFEHSTASLQMVVPPSFTVRRVLSGSSGAVVARHELHGAISDGQLIVNYIGHGSVRIWGRESLLTSDDVSSWQNAGRLPLVVAMNCLNGFFHGIYDEESLAETLLRTSGSGAVAAWASSGVTNPAIQTRVNQELFRLLFNSPSLTIAQAATLAKRVVSDRDIRRSWIFFGDPALRLKGIAAADSSRKSSGSTTGTDALASNLAVTPPPLAPDVTRRLSDWNNDGRADVFLHAESGWRAILTAPEGEKVLSGRWNAAWEVYPANLNGDGLEDMVLVHRSNGVMRHGINDGAGNFQYTDGLLGEGWQVHVADLNGDRLDDLLLTMQDFGFWFTLLNEGNGHFKSRAGSWVAASSVTLGDFNGDQRTDAFLYDPETGRWTSAFSDGDGAFTYRSGNTNTDWTIRRINADGDTRADLLLYNPKTGAWAEWASQASSFAVRNGVWKAGLNVRAIDGEIEGRDDVLLYDANSGAWTLILTKNGTPKYLDGVWRPGLTIATGDLNGDGRTDLLLHDSNTGEWHKGLRNKAGAFDFTSGRWAAGWTLASRP